MNPSPDERRLLRGLAANSPDPDGWWSRDALAAAFPDVFGHLTRQQVSAAGRQAAGHGMAFSRTRRTHARQWQEWRIRAFGMGLVSDSCIGSGRNWALDGGTPRCPACLTGALRFGPASVGASTVPGHPLPGYRFPLAQTGLRAITEGSGGAWGTVFITERGAS